MEYIDSSQTGPTGVGDEGVVEQDTLVGPREGRAKRRSFTAEYKRRMVAEYDAAPKGSKGAVLRRERLYVSHIQEWRAAIEAGTLDTPAKRGRPTGSGRSPEQARIAQLERENARLLAELDKKDEVIAQRDDALEVLGKGVAFLEALSGRRSPSKTSPRWSGLWRRAGWSAVRGRRIIVMRTPSRGCMGRGAGHCTRPS